MLLTETRPASAGRDADDRVCARIECELRRHYGALQHVSCQSNGHGLVLEGTVPSYFLKQVAQTIALRHAPHVENHISVVRPTR